ncbi:hypothetical protein [Xanthobacter flavus]|uniref:hypothetical protein n=1 Tax=Xanthobacter flavus TaxID=281 RepID=UPI001AE400A8|nr:hypothetical protein [Xanthobacter flavus]MBP2147630.1 hypothetical protein [Xanthobacter flavus]
MRTYLDDRTYSELIYALLHLKPTHFSGRVDYSDVAMALGEVADIWPKCILPHEIRAHWEDENPPPACGQRWSDSVKSTPEVV